MQLETTNATPQALTFCEQTKTSSTSFDMF